MQITIDDKTVDFELKKKKVALKDVVDEVEQFLFSVGKIPISLCIDGKEMTQEELDQRLENIMEGKEALKFGTINVLEFVKQNIEGAQEANGGLVAKVQSFADELHDQNKSVDLREVTSEIEHFFAFWTRIHGLVPDVFASITFKDQSFDTFLESMHTLLKEILDAMNSQDFVLAADLLQYEVIPVIEEIGQHIPKMMTTLDERIAKDRENAGKEG